METNRVYVCGVPVDCLDFRRTVDVARELLRRDGPSSILAMNPEKVVRCRRDPVLLAAIESATLLIPDGIGVVLAARLLHRASIARVPGCELMPALCAVAAAEGRGVFLFGGAPGVPERAAAALERHHPTLRVLGCQHGFVPQVQMDALIDRINQLKPAILFVGLGTPRQEIWIKQHISKLQVQVCQGVGGTFDVLAGDVKRAPKVFRATYLEWFYRLASDPRRIHRQLAYPIFVAWVLRELFSSRSPAHRRKLLPP
jgi:N-acetylglucosaminyldiphosphoundecaprenol N-acetyl-beta-D-mannosaminyltransferase